MPKFVKLNVYEGTHHNVKVLAAIQKMHMADLIDKLVEDAMLTHQEQVIKTLLEPEYDGRGNA